MDLLDCVRKRSGISACYTWCKPLPQPWNVRDLWRGTRIFEEATLEQLPMVFVWAQQLGRSEPQPIKAKTHWVSGGHQLHIQTPPSYQITSLKILLKGTKTRKQPHRVTGIKACRCWYEWEPHQEPYCVLETQWWTTAGCASHLQVTAAWEALEHVLEVEDVIPTCEITKCSTRSFTFWLHSPTTATLCACDPWH